MLQVARDLDKIETRKSLGLLGRDKINRYTLRFISGFVMREGALRFFLVVSVRELNY